ncbi:probable malonyl-CoA-acyl carrier protein transacylase, mitochondrial [Phlebotomus argentipes]|uniref:probable malonyl-CoA-acyl carrier protein transacylase, mitochondrial n=1 Tax=Phlebotomus argentipes TaxID=94469 RepID=UPI002892CD28|nr:probable malonyl-CoA-acyl carrier protein transacylase, mitochondrial [Phlebotomus argentipes]XP_059620271.1 probable malonyl-CoA-acyl carrier protein transacylase, mitochondrial [Phlebotomus argentipes]
MLLRRFSRRLFCTKPPPGGSSNVQELLDNAATFEDITPKTPDDEWATLPYPEGTSYRQSQAAKSRKPKKDPRKTSIILFPGQGAQFVGMGKDLVKIPSAKDMFSLASEILKFDVLKVCLEGPVAKLNSTRYCQPAVLVASLAALEKLKEERPAAIDECYATAGFSLGEITALIFAGSIPFDQGLRLVQVRAEAMQLASDAAAGGMATVLYGPDSKVGQACLRAKEWCIERGVENPECLVANYLYPHCKVVAGSEEALKFLETSAKEFGLRRVKRLPVSGAFHSSLMEAAVLPFRRALDKIELSDPLISVHSNVDGKRYRGAEHVRKQLPKQIVRPVRWEQTLHILYERAQGTYFPRTFEVGPGRALTTILKQVNAKAADHAFNISP